VDLQAGGEYHAQRHAHGRSSRQKDLKPPGWIRKTEAFSRVSEDLDDVPTVLEEGMGVNALRRRGVQIRSTRMTNANAGQVFVPRARRFASVSSYALATRAASWALVLMVSLPIGARVEGQQLPGIPAVGTEEAAAALVPTSPDEIASRRAMVDAELRDVDEMLEDADPGTAEHLLAVRERLREVSGLLEQQATVVSRAAPLKNVPLPAAEAPSVFALNSLYEAQLSQEQGGRKNEDRWAASREALATAKEMLATSERERRRARAELETASPSEKANAESILELRELESRIAQERVYLRRAERLAVQDAGEDPTVVELDERIVAMRIALERGEGSSESGFAALTGLAEELRRWREATERRLATAELHLEAARSRYVQQEPSAERLAQVEALAARR